MKTGSTISQVLTTVKAEAERAKDYVVDTRALSMRGGRLAMRIGDAHIETEVRETAHHQIAERLGIPRSFYDTLRAKHGDLLDYNVSQLFQREPQRRMVRTLDGVPMATTRALLSDRYRRFDNWQVADAVLPELATQPEVRFESTELTERRMYLKAILPRIEGEVTKGDVVQAGILVSNSEIGGGATEVAMILYRLVCSNGLVVEDSRSRRHHVGRSLGGDEEEAQRLFADETIQADDHAYMLKLRDVVRSSITEARFQEVLSQARGAAEDRSEVGPTQLVERLSNRIGASKTEADALLQHLCAGGDFSRWGVTNAITRMSQDVESYDRATELERVGGQILVAGNPLWVAASRN